MKIVIQKVKEASVRVESQEIGVINQGLVLLVGMETGDTEKDCIRAADKVPQLRIFDDDMGKMNLSLKDVQGSILSISQFTLAADIRKGNRPSFINATAPDEANRLFELFNTQLRNQGIHVQTGKFQAHMNVVLNNDGPVTIIMNIKDGKVY